MSDNEGPREESQQPEAEQPRAKRTALVIGVAAVAAGAIALAVYNARPYYPRARLPADEPMIEYGVLPHDFGSADAQLKIEVCVGPRITFVAGAIAEAVEAWPDKVRAEFYEYHSEAGQAFVKEHGEELACIVFNGKNRFTVEQDGQERQLHLAGPPSGEYTMGDVAVVLRQQWLEVYGEVPEGFDDKLTALAQAEEPSAEK
jgi:hypothetical protein